MTSQLVFILGTRPEIIKLAPVIRACEHAGVEYSLVHTGQHYSDELDEVFFDDLELRAPDYNLEVGSDSHGRQTGEMLLGLDEVLDAERPDTVVVQGDTNSALAGGMVASKRDCELAHVEAGLRSFDREMPEEINRVLIDHAASWLFAPTREAAEQLREENVPDDRIAVTGNTIVDAVRENAQLAVSKSDVLSDLGLEREEFALLTLHRAKNVDDEARFASLLEGVARYARRTDTEVIYPIHPHAADRIEAFGLRVPDRVRLVDPLSFLDFLRLESTAAIVFTDSGGVQEEACVVGTPCVTLRNNTERPETLTVGSNVLAGDDLSDIVEAGLEMRFGCGDWDVPFGDGNAAIRILDHLGIESSVSTTSAPSPDRVSQ